MLWVCKFMEFLQWYLVQMVLIFLSPICFAFVLILYVLLFYCFYFIVLLISLTLFFFPSFICFSFPCFARFPFCPQPKSRSPSLRHIRSARSQTLPGRFTNQSPQTLPVYRPRLTSDLTNSGNRGTNSKQQQQQQRVRRHTFSGNPLGPQTGPFKARTLHASNSLTIDPLEMHN